MKFTRTAGLAMGIALVASAAFVPSAYAADTVTLTITGGERTASVADFGLTAVGYSHSLQNTPGDMVLTADDSTGSAAGWNVTILSSNFVHDGTGIDIPATGFGLTSAAQPVATAGQAVVGTGLLGDAGPKVPMDVSPVGALSDARKVVQADAGFGQGTYTQALGVSLAIPADTRAGTYTGLLTTTIAAAP